MIMKISVAGASAIIAHFKGHTVHTDQPEKAGGHDTGPAPFDLFLASIGTCAGYYAAQFCTKRGIDTDDLELTLEPIRDEERHRVGKIRLGLRLPGDFPPKYRAAILRAIDQCTVKRHILEPPEFEVAALDAVGEEA